MRQRQRRDSAREWLRTAVTITIASYAKRYGVDRYTAYDDLTALGVALPASARQWAKRPPATPPRTVRQGRQEADQPGHDCWTMLDGRPFFVAGYTTGGAPYGIFADEIPEHGPLINSGLGDNGHHV